MFDFSKVKESIINDLKKVCTQNYWMLQEISNLPKEVNFIISHNMLLNSDELVTLDEDIKYTYNMSFRSLIDRNKIDILSEYSEYFKHLPDINYSDYIAIDYYQKKELRLKECINILYCLDKNIFYKLLFRYTNKSYKEYERQYRRNINYYKCVMQLKTDTKYIKLLQIVNLENFLEFS